MSARRQSVCLLCRIRKSVLRQQCRPRKISRRHLQTIVHVAPENDVFLLAPPKSRRFRDVGAPQSREAAICQGRLDDPFDSRRVSSLGFEALYEHRDLRIQILRKLSNPWPPPSNSPKQSAQRDPRLPEASAAVVPHDKFRLTVRQALDPTAMRRVLSKQLLRCERPREILRVLAVAMQIPAATDCIPLLSHPIVRALFRCRQHVSDPEVLQTLTTIITRLRHEALPVEPMLLFVALKFAARSRSLQAMKRYLFAIRKEQLTLTSNVFRSVIAKFSIGWRGLGEIRNGRWNRSDLLQVLTGFRDATHLPIEQQYHIGSFLDRSEWHDWHGWITVLARCKDSASIRVEWELWKQTDARTVPKKLDFQAQDGQVVTTRTRGDRCFIEQMTYAGDLAKAWHMLGETSIQFHTLNVRVRDKLLEQVELAGTMWDEQIKEEMVRKYDRDLSRIEAALGVRWINNGNGGEGRHELFMDQEEALDKLGERGWRLDDDYGFPWETMPLVPENERSLHKAVESQRDDEIDIPVA